jgi:hypothetical protein
LLLFAQLAGLLLRCRLLFCLLALLLRLLCPLLLLLLDLLLVQHLLHHGVRCWHVSCFYIRIEHGCICRLQDEAAGQGNSQPWKPPDTHM